MTNIEKTLFFKLLNHGGYVLDFSTSNFDIFTKESIGVALCSHYGRSKGASLECYCTEAPDDKVLKLLGDLLEYYDSVFLLNERISKDFFNKPLYEKCKSIIDSEKAKLSNQLPNAPATSDLTVGDIKTFTKKLKYIKTLGSGATGSTYLFEDISSNRKLAIKKLEPITSESSETSYERFVNEASLLSQTYHPNIVRLYDYYLFPNAKIGFITMEYVEGDPIGSVSPEKYGKTWEDFFTQLIDGFAHLEKHKITHRDIQENNILVSHDGIVKIIDFGFSKQINSDKDLSKSISLNRITSQKPEEERKGNTYDEKTEIYYVGALFKVVVPESYFEKFAYKDIVTRMCQIHPDERFSSFKEIQEKITDSPESSKLFIEEEILAYREISEKLRNYLIEWHEKPVFFTTNEILSKIEALTESICLEEYIHDLAMFVRCFTNTGYKYRSSYIRPDTENIQTFYRTLKYGNQRKRFVLINNIQTTFKTVKIQETKPDFSDIPF